MDKTFWLNNPLIFINNYKNFIPKKDASRLEQMNQATLGSLYLLIIMTVGGVKNTIFYVILISIILYIIYLNYTKMNNNKQTKEEFITQETIDDLKPGIESGYYDSDAKIKLNKLYPSAYKNDKLDTMVRKETIKNKTFIENLEKKITDVMNPDLQYKEELKRKPTLGNPYMNPLLVDYNTENVIFPVNADDEDVKRSMVLEFNKDLFKDTSQLFDEKNIERQFYTVAGASIPNDQQKFAEWCYKIPVTCKEDTRACKIAEDLRQKTSYR